MNSLDARRFSDKPLFDRLACQLKKLAMERADRPRSTNSVIFFGLEPYSSLPAVMNATGSSLQRRFVVKILSPRSTRVGSFEK